MGKGYLGSVYRDKLGAAFLKQRQMRVETSVAVLPQRQAKGVHLHPERSPKRKMRLQKYKPALPPLCLAAGPLAEEGAGGAPGGPLPLARSATCSLPGLGAAGAAALGHPVSPPGGRLLSGQREALLPVCPALLLLLGVFFFIIIIFSDMKLGSPAGGAEQS